MKQKNVAFENAHKTAIKLKYLNYLSDLYFAIFSLLNRKPNKKTGSNKSNKRIYLNEWLLICIMIGYS